MAALQLTVTPGTNFTDGAAVTADDLNLAAAPSVELAEASIQPEHIDIDPLVTAIGDSLRGTNYLPWGDIMEHLFPAASIACAAGIKTPVQPGWWVRPTSAATTATPSPRSDDDTATEPGRSGLKVIGDASLTVMEIGTYLPPGLTQQLSGGSITISFYVWNNTGAFTPLLKVYTSSTAGDEAASTERQSITGQSCANGAWTRVEFTFDASTTTDWNKGANITLHITKTASVLDTGTDYVLVADAQIDTGTAATAIIHVPPVFSHVPPGTMFPFAGSVAPPGWLLCNLEATSLTGKSRTAYARLFAAIGTAYGVGDNSATFNLPDMRGRTFVGAEVAGSSAGRMEVSVSAVSSSGDTITVASGAADSLRLGMGAFGNAGIATGSYIIAITATTIQLSASITGSISGTIRFSKLGAEDAQTVGADGSGMSYGRRLLSFTKGGCSTSGASTTMVVPNLTDLACGMTVSGTNVTAGTTIAAFISATSVRLSAASGGSVSGIVTFGVNAPEGDQMMEWERLKRTIVIAGCGWNIDTGAPYKLDLGPGTETGIPYVDLLAVGMSVSGDTIPANSYITVVGVGEVEINNSITAANTNPTATDVTFTKVSTARSTTPTPDTLPAAVGNWIIKT